MIPAPRRARTAAVMHENDPLWKLRHALAGVGLSVLLSVPLHEQMANDPRIDTGKRLVQTNWPRSIAWTAHGVTALVMVAQAWA